MIAVGVSMSRAPCYFKGYSWATSPACLALLFSSLEVQRSFLRQIQGSNHFDAITTDSTVVSCRENRKSVNKSVNVAGGDGVGNAIGGVVDVWIRTRLVTDVSYHEAALRFNLPGGTKMPYDSIWQQ